MNASFNEFLSQLTQPTEATAWLTSDHVTNLLDKWRKERFDNRECACGNIIPEHQVHECAGFDEFICRECR